MDVISNMNNPVWDVYDQYRAVRVNVLRYDKQLTWTERKNKWMDIFIAVSTSSTAASMWFVKYTYFGDYTWQVCSVVAVILSIIKPILKYQDKIKVTRALLAEYRALDYAYQKLVISIKQRRKYDDELKNKFLVLLDKRARITDEFVAGPIASIQRNRAFDQANEELPPQDFYVPEV